MLSMRDPTPQVPPTPLPASSPVPQATPTPTPEPEVELGPFCEKDAVRASQPNLCPELTTALPASTGVITVTAPKTNLVEDEDMQLSATIAAVDVTATVTWTTSDRNVLRVSAAGVVEAQRPGIAFVTAAQGTDSTSMWIRVSGLLGVIPVSGIPSHAVKRPNSSEIWVVSSWSNVVSIIDACSQKVTATINLGGIAGSTRVGSLSFRPDGTLAYVATDLGVQVFATSSKTLVKLITHLTGRGQFAHTPDGSLVLYQDEDGSVSRIRPDTNGVTPHDNETPAITARGIAILPFGDYRTYVAADEVVYQFPKAIEAADVHANGSLPGGPFSSLFASPNGDFLFVTPSTTNPDNAGFMAIVGDGNFEVSTIIESPGAWTFFDDDSRAVWANQFEGYYMVRQYNTGDLQDLVEIPIPPPTPECRSAAACESDTWVTSRQHARGTVGITPDMILYMPVRNCSTVGVYQFY